MAADYSKACAHERTGASATRTYCLDCGEDLTLLRMAEQDRMTAPPPHPIDTSGLGPIKLDYTTAVGDAKTLNWRKISLGMGRLNLPMPVDKPFYAAWQEMPWGTTDRRWRVERVEVGQLLPALAMWWADDLLGLPPCND